MWAEGLGWFRRYGWRSRRVAALAPLHVCAALAPLHFVTAHPPPHFLCGPRPPLFVVRASCCGHLRGQRISENTAMCCSAPRLLLYTPTEALCSRPTFLPPAPPHRLLRPPETHGRRWREVDLKIEMGTRAAGNSRVETCFFFLVFALFCVLFVAVGSG